MKLLLTHGTSTRDVTELMVSWNWSGDKASISRQLTGEISYVEGGNLPVPALGDVVTMDNDGKRLFVGIILLRSLGSESSTLSFTAYDYGYYLQQNDGAYKFTGAGADASARKLLENGKVEKTVTVNVLKEPFHSYFAIERTFLLLCQQVQLLTLPCCIL